MSASGPSSGFAFGPFRLDPAKRLLYRNDQLLPLRPKVIDVLIMLVERKGDLVEKDELIQCIWPDAAVEESNLPTTVSALRRTLGDGYIETVPRRGYRFAAILREPVAESYSAKPAKRPIRFRIACAIGLAAIMLVAWRLHSLRNQPVEAAWKTEPLTTLEGAEVFPAFSPDAKSIVFLWTGGSSDRGDLYMKRLGQSEITRLTNDDAIECYPAWSPDGKWIAFLHCGPGAIEGFIASTASVYVIPAGGGKSAK